jgi:hypothetical protein
VSSTIRRRAILPMLALLAGLLLSGCGAGFTAMTNIQFAPGNGATADAGQIAVRNALLVQDSGSGLVSLYTVFVNSGPEDTLSSITVAGANPVTLPNGPIDLPTNQQVSLGPNGTELLVNGLTISPGFLALVTYTFQNAGSVSAEVLLTTPQNITG